MAFALHTTAQTSKAIISIVCLMQIFLNCNSALAESPLSDDSFLDFEDQILKNEITYPDWFKLSLGDLRDDLAAAVKNGKTGIVVYYGQKRCAYCGQFITMLEKSKDIQRYLRDHFDIIPVDIWGVEEITDTDGKNYTEHELAVRYNTNFTPSVVFYDSEGTPVFRLRGYHPPYNFLAALQYTVEKFYKSENFRDYLDRAIPGIFFKQGALNERDFFVSPPYNLQKLGREKRGPIAVFFEQGSCHACDVLHTGPLNNEEALNEMSNVAAIQLNMWSSIPVITPKGETTTARRWAEKLELFYAPTIIFFDEKGEEIIRLDSVVKLYRLLGVLRYINTGSYLDEPNYQHWRLKQRKTR